MNLIPAGNGYLCPDDPGEPGLGKQRWSVNDLEARIVAELFRGLTVLEIGTGLGVSTKKIAEKAKMVYTVDIDRWVEENVVPTLPENVVFYNSLADIPDVDAAFIDGLHSLDQCEIDIKDARRLVKNGGLIVLHDSKMPAIRMAMGRSGLRFCDIITSAGIALGWNEKLEGGRE